jgi:hypothetical protein
LAGFVLGFVFGSAAVLDAVWQLVKVVFNVGLGGLIVV